MSEIRKLTRTGGGRAMSVVIAADLIDALRWRDRQRVLIKKVNGTIVIRDAKTKMRK
jgi:hypothetical protein